jgi:hypothetical protein
VNALTSDAIRISSHGSSLGNEMAGTSPAMT